MVISFLFARFGAPKRLENVFLTELEPVPFPQIEQLITFRRRPMSMEAATTPSLTQFAHMQPQAGATIVSPPREYPEYTPPGYYALFFKDLLSATVLLFLDARRYQTA